MQDCNLTITDNIERGRLYAGPVLPIASRIRGTVTRDGHDTGALVELVTGHLVQVNAGVIRRLPHLITEIA